MGNKVKDFREQKGMTQLELAQKSGVSRITISQIENGVERNTTTKTVLNIAKALGTTVDELFFKDDV